MFKYIHFIKLSDKMKWSSTELHSVPLLSWSCHVWWMQFEWDQLRLFKSNSFKFQQWFILINTTVVIQIQMKYLLAFNKLFEIQSFNISPCRYDYLNTIIMETKLSVFKCFPFYLSFWCVNNSSCLYDSSLSLNWKK